MTSIDAIKFKELWPIAVQRKWLIIGCVALSLCLAWVLCLVLPPRYRSSTLIMVENQKVPENYVSSVIGGSSSDRLTQIQQQVHSRTVISRLIAEFNLYQTPGVQQDPEVGIETMRKLITIELRGGGAGSRVESFVITFAHADPQTAMKVTDRLASTIIDENLKMRELLVAGTTEFLNNQLDIARHSLESQEESIAQFKRQHMGELPGQMEANLATLSRLQLELADVNERLQHKNDRRASVQQTITAYEGLGQVNLQAPSMSQQLLRMEGASVRRNGSAGADPFTARLRELEKMLATLTAEYKDAYPDIIQVKHEIALVKAQLADRHGATTPEKVDQEKTAIHSERTSVPVEVDSYLLELKKELNENEIGIASMKEHETRLKSQVKDYEFRVEKAPEREQELTVLQRDYENTKKNYAVLLDKQLNAKISEDLEKRQKGEKFRVLDPANLPTKPESPDKLKIMLAGLVLGCGLGYGAAFGLEFMAGVIRRPEDAERLFGLPVLGTISHFELAYENEPTKALSGSSVTSPSGTSPKGSMLALRPALSEKSQSGLGRKAFGQLWKKDSDWSRYRPKNGAVTDSIMLELNLVAKWRPFSMVTEQFRVAATRLVLSSTNQKSTVVVVTSALKGEGKSTTASNLAYVLAQDLGKQTLLVDCDFKRPMIDAYMGVPSKPGLVEAIYGDATLETCLHRSGDIPLWILPSGRRDHRFVDLTKFPQIIGILTELRARFEFIILDAPPVLPLADMNLLASIADMLILVVRTGVTHHEVVQKSLKALKPLSRAGIILTGYDQGNDSEYLLDYYHAGQGTNHK